jgi:hypothetical protein
MGRGVDHVGPGFQMAAPRHTQISTDCGAK